MSNQIDPKEISLTGMDLVHHYYWSVPIIQMCRNTIKQHLFSNGIQYKGKDGQNKQLLSQQLMEDYWLPFCEDALDSAMCYGFVVWRTRKVGDTIVPIVCMKDTYTVKMKIEDGVIEYKIYDTEEKSTETIKGAYIYDEFGYKPKLNGSLMSIINTLIPDIQYYYTMLNCQVKLEKKRVTPPILTQIHERKGMGATGENEGIDYDFYADADIANAEDDAKYKRNRKAIEDLRTQQKLYDEFFEPNTNTEEYSAPTILDQMVALPSGQSIAPYPLQQGRNDLPVILKQLQDTICGVLGVPKSMIMSDTPHKADTTGTHQIFQSTILWWKRQMSEMCQMIYNIINAQEIADKVNDKISKRKQSSSGDIYMATRGLQSNITFPVTPFVSNEELYLLYQRGVIDWENYCNYISRNTSIPLLKIPPEPTQQLESNQQNNVVKSDPKSDPKSEKKTEPNNEKNAKKRKSRVLDNNQANKKKK